mmetsp:Transcript_32949/g.74607  ORF Transcript_32949/g.74607 Transcript_32949/m.74607 type:complete len:243 (-) Transcript_32949:21-749(-)
MNAVKVLVATAALLVPVCIDAAFQSQRHAMARWHHGLQMKSEDSGSTPIDHVDRRRFATSALSSFSVFIGSTRRTSATEFGEGRPPLETPFLSGSCVIKPGAIPPVDANAALYVTARPESLSSAPGSLFDMLVGNYGGKPPAVLTARYPIYGGAAPYEFELSTSDLTEEGSFSTSTDKSEGLWWQNDNLIISARLDSDGVASSRDPEDLVGRISCSAKDSRSGLQIELSGRGMFGKSVTRKK